MRFSPGWDDWLKSERPKHSIYPHELDYCYFCAKEELRHETTLNCIHQTGSADGEEQKRIEAEITALTEELEKHHEEAKKSHEYYIQLKIDAKIRGKKSSPFKVNQSGLNRKRTPYRG